MKQLAQCVGIVFLGGAAVVSGHEGFEHVHGMVTALEAYSFTVKTEASGSVMLSVTPRTTVKKNGRVVEFKDLKTGDWVAIEVPEHTVVAEEIEVIPASQKRVKKR